ncbi:MAG: heavy metal translocating P-type ATPase, partial [Chloroflexi bacterium]|nr:heavy metal translocating P-type ATPase [Chloroflexota bacterium]
PIDGTIVKGESAIDQSSITGESIPVHKAVGDDVFAGTVNQHGALEVKATRQANDSTLSKIIRMVEQAQAQRAPTQRFLDTFEQYYALAVIAGVALFLLGGLLLFNQPFDTHFYRSMVLLVVASPCALVISTPASILSAIANAARAGILFKGGVHLENAATLKAVAFDKTGTLTYGRPELTDVLSLSGLAEEQVLGYAASAEALSEHALARAVLDASKQRGLAITQPDEFQALPGRGVQAIVNGEVIRVGHERFLSEEGVTMTDEVRSTRDRLEDEGKTVLLVARAADCIGLVAVADRVREDAKDAVAALRRAGIDHIIMLTGDNERVARAIAQQVGVDEYHAQLLPDEKVTRLKELEARVGRSAMIGDGVNDAPALAAATIGVAMGAAGTDVALETADVVLMSDDLNKLAYAIRLSHKARRVVWQNIAFSLSVILLLIIGTLGADLVLPLGVVGHEGSTVLVVFNGLRLLGFSDGA